MSGLVFFFQPRVKIQNKLGTLCLDIIKINLKIINLITYLVKQT